MAIPKTLEELLAHPDYPRLLEAGPRTGGPARSRRFRPLLLMAAFLLVVGYLVRPDRSPEESRLSPYVPLIAFAVVFAVMLWRRGVSPRRLRAQAVRVEEVGSVHGSARRTCRVRLFPGQPPPLDLDAGEVLAAQLVAGDVGVAYHDGRRLVDLRRFDDPDLLL